MSNKDMTVKVKLEGESGSAVKAMDEAAKSGTRLRDAMGRFVGTGKVSAEALDEVGDSGKKAGKGLDDASGSAAKAMDAVTKSGARLRETMGRVVGAGKASAEVLKEAGDSGKKAGEGLGAASGAAEGMTLSFVKAQIVTSAITTVLALLKQSAGDLVKESALMAARFETSGVVMGVVGNNTGRTRKEMDAYADSLQKSGISMQASRDGLTKMAQAHLDLSKAQALSRLAQDAAVIGNINSSEAFQTLIYGIQSGQTDVLRTIGLNVQFEASYAKLAKTLGKSKESLTEDEKAQARLNEVLERAPDIAGAYEESMKTVGKQLLSTPRYADDLRISLGRVFGGALHVGVQEVNSDLQQMKKWLDANAIAASLVDENLAGAASNFVGIVHDVTSLGSGVNDVVEGFSLWEILAADLNLVIAGIRDSVDATLGFFELTVYGPLALVDNLVEKLVSSVAWLFGTTAPKWLTDLTAWSNKGLGKAWNQLGSGLSGNNLRRFYNGPEEKVTDPTADYQRQPYSLTEHDKVVAAKRAAAEAAHRTVGTTKKTDQVSESEHQARLAQWKAEAAERETLKEQESAAILKVEADLQRDLAKLQEENAPDASGNRKLSNAKYLEEKTAVEAKAEAEKQRIQEDYAEKRKQLEERLNSQIEAADGDSLDRRLAAIQKNFAEIRKEADSLGKGEAFKLRIDDAEARATVRAQADALSKDFQFLQAELQADEQGITNLLDANLISTLDARQRQADAIEQRLPALQQKLQAMQAQADAAQAKANQTGNTDDATLANELTHKAREATSAVQGLQTNMAACRNQWASLEQAGVSALANGLVDVLMQAGKGFRFLEEAGLDMARNLVSALQEVLAKMLLMKAAQAMLGGYGEGSWQTTALSLFSKAVGFAAGGYTGDGDPREAAGFVHRREFVHDHETTEFWGTDFLESLHPRNWRNRGHFAGGQVGPPSVGELSANFRHEVSLGLDRGLILEAFDSPDGARIVAKHLNANPRRMNRALGGGR